MPICHVETERRSRDVLAMVMTPDRIPPFIIPSLAPAEGRRSRCYSLDLSRLRDRRELLQDPVTRAAMSLPHLSKITTPYGFLTLGESPCVGRKESLFFDPLPAPLWPRPDPPFSWDASSRRARSEGALVREKNRLQLLLKKHLAGRKGRGSGGSTAWTRCSLAVAAAT
ncbi:C2 calcium-dependent domain-containing protein 4A [Microcaecilia unicolor]|uniref:C2 calcium-dependent domain-containing protein 4A-like n=1 Tax=Microcaecilia unicolor TaxID=1415580 RepID=A0A6P7WRP5_9AMPH|nr:C2 calcium-dependent domain-containing protein 4A-like [Microcaecilia unicolor]